MPILTHSTKRKFLDCILSGGLKVPMDTGHCNWPTFSKHDRISLKLRANSPDDEFVHINPWNNYSCTFSLNPDYIKQNSQLFKYHYDEEEVIAFAKQFGLKKIENGDGRAAPSEIVSFENIPVEGLHSLFLDLDIYDVNHIRKSLPNHMRLYAPTEEIDIYKRIK